MSQLPGKKSQGTSDYHQKGGVVNFLSYEIANDRAPSSRLPLAPYRRHRSNLEKVIKYGTLLIACVALGLFYGFAIALLPVQMYVILALPVAALSLIVVWALPELPIGPTKLLMRLYLIYVCVLVLWPNYLSIQLPGLPWISLRRLVSLLSAVVFVISYSVSRSVRERLSELKKSSPLLLRAVALFATIQFLTLFLSPSIFGAFSSTLDMWLGTTVLFFIAAWALTFDRVRYIFLTTLIVCTGLLCLLGVAEALNKQVLWANYIPSFLQIGDEVIERILTPQLRDGKYRVTTVFTVSLCFAEFLAIVVPFVIHRVTSAKALKAQVAWGFFDLLILVVIGQTQSRLGILGWLIAHASYLTLWAFRRWKRERGDILAPALSLGAACGAFLFFVGMFTVDAIKYRTIGGGSTGHSDDARREQFALLWPKLWANPFGYGTGSSGNVLGFRQPGGLLSVDSYVITVLLDYGVLGFLLFFGMFVYASVKMGRIYWRSEHPISDLALPLFSSMLVIIQIRTVLSQTDNLSFIFTLLAFVASIIWWEQKRLGAEASTTRAAA